MKIPTTLKIGGHQITVDSSQALESVNGDYDSQTNTIRIDKNIARSVQESTLIHEILHVCNTTLEGDNAMGHALLDSLAEQLYQVLTDNDLLK